MRRPRCPALWHALRDVVQFWVDQGVRIFRVDNPHTKPLPFWRWMIADIRDRHPDVIFLAEAFTRPKVMYRLAKVGFTQSYTYFTWRNTKQEITEYLTELTHAAGQRLLPPEFLRQHAGHQPGLPADLRPRRLPDPRRAGHDAVRAVGHVFRLRDLRGRAAAGPRGIPRLGKIRNPRARLQRARQHRRRRSPRSIASAARIRRCRRISACSFYTAFNDQILLFGKRRPDGGDMILVAVSLDPHNVQEPISNSRYGNSASRTTRARRNDLMRGIASPGTARPSTSASTPPICRSPSGRISRTA